MQKAIILFMMFLLSIGLTQPHGYMQYRNLQEEYAACSIEDHDITPLDFIFEHLLNLESIVNILEGEYDYTNGDHPHQPFEATGSIGQIVVVIPPTYQFDIAQQHFLPLVPVKYPARRSDFYLSVFCTDILRPPIYLS